MKEKFAILFLITFLFLNAVGFASVAKANPESDSVIYPDSKVNGHANQNAPFFSQREVQAIILEGKTTLFVERNYQQARKCFEVALGVDATNAIACYFLGVIELEEGNPEAAKARFRQAHELVNAQTTPQSILNPAASPFNSGILPPHTQFKWRGGNGDNLSSSRNIGAPLQATTQERSGFSDYIPPQTALPLENQWISVNGTPMNIGQSGAVSDSDGIYLPALVKFPSQYRVHVYSQDGWNISLKEETPPINGRIYSGRGDAQTVRKWRENGETVYSFPPNSTYNIKVEPKNKNRAPLYMATVVVAAVVGWLVIR